MTFYEFDELQTKVDENNSLYIMAFAPGRRTPVAMLRLDLDEPAGYVTSLFVDEAHRRAGLATSLLARAALRTKADGKQTLGLSVHKDNPDARRLYERLGYKPFTKGYEAYLQLVKFLE